MVHFLYLRKHDKCIMLLIAKTISKHYTRGVRVDLQNVRLNFQILFCELQELQVHEYTLLHSYQNLETSDIQC